MLRKRLNLGILAHVDAGKTTLTERLLYGAGVIGEIGSVDDGTTQTDSLALERQRGITIKSAVVSFAVGDVTVNLIDTPGHPDFIAEVERALAVLDGAVLVISAVEGVQPQTPILMRALRRLRVPTLLFVNKIDRRGADCTAVLRTAAQRLTPAIAPMGSVRKQGTPGAAFTPADRTDDGLRARLAEVLAEHSELVLAAYLDGERPVPYAMLRRELRRQARQGSVYPVFFGSALTGAGVADLIAGVAELLPAAGGDAGGPVAGRVFKIERGAAGEKIAYVRMFSGTLRTRQRVRFGAAEDAGGARGPGGADGAGGRGAGRVTAISVFTRGAAATPHRSLSAGEIGKVWGLAGIQVGDPVGAPRADAGRGGEAEPGRQFAPPTLETVVTPRRARDSGALRAALAQLAEQDPLISVRQDDTPHEIYLSLYGEVQKEVIGATLAADFGLAVGFRETTTICIERPARTGAAVERLHQPPNPFLATVGLRVEPAAAGSGVEFRIEAELGSMPLAYFRAVEDTVRHTLLQGLHGWQVTDCRVTMTHSGYLGKHSLGHQPFSKSLSSTGEDFRKLTPLVLMTALLRAGTVVCEPIHRFRLDLPAGTLGLLLPALARLGAIPRQQFTDDGTATVEGDIPAAAVHGLRQRLPALTGGEGVLECTFDRYQPVSGAVPARPRTDDNPLNRAEYLQRVTRHAVSGGDRP